MIKSLAYASQFNEIVNALFPQYASTVNPCVAGIPFQYYPFMYDFSKWITFLYSHPFKYVLQKSRNQPNYMQPMVVVRVTATPNSNPNIQCSAWNSNIDINAKQGYGSVQFSVKVAFFQNF
jgi:hypothetical protein